MPGRAARNTGAGRTALALLAAASALPVVRAQETPAERWRDEMEAFPRLDAGSPAAPGAILFLGSSSIRMWDLEEWFPGLPALNRGFGGSEISDSIHLIDRLVFPHAPAAIVFYAGDNDVAAGEPPEQVAADFARFASLVHERLPECRIVFLAIEPSLARWELWGAMRVANRLVTRFAERRPNVSFLDVATPMLGADGRPRPELLAEDGLHLSRAGYALWSERVCERLAALEAIRSR